MNHLPKINSRDNQKLKFARSVREGRENNKIFIEGMRLAEEILKTNLAINFVFLTPNFLKNNRGTGILKRFAGKQVELFELEDRIFDSIADTKNSQGIILIADKPNTGKEIIEFNLGQNSLLLLLHKLNNPTNLGAILRTAEAAGVNGLITTKGTVDVFSAKALRGGMGANLRLPLWVNADFTEVIKWAKLKKLKTICADIRSPENYLEIDWNIPRLLIVGSEGHGLTRAERDLTEEGLIIPMENGVESLNVAVACGIILFEAKRQRGLKGKI